VACKGHPYLDRQVNDYGDIWAVNQEEAETIFSEATLFVESVDAFLKKQQK